MSTFASHVVTTTILHDEFTTSRTFLYLITQCQLDINVDIWQCVLIISCPLMLAHKAHQSVVAPVAQTKTTMLRAVDLHFCWIEDIVLEPPAIGKLPFKRLHLAIASARVHPQLSGCPALTSWSKTAQVGLLLNTAPRDLGLCPLCPAVLTRHMSTLIIPHQDHTAISADATLRPYLRRSLPKVQQFIAESTKACQLCLQAIFERLDRAGAGINMFLDVLTDDVLAALCKATAMQVGE